MNIAATVKDGLLCPVDEAELVRFYTMEKGVLSASESAHMPAGFGEALELLRQKDARVLLCAGIGPEERSAAGKAGLAIFVKDRVSAGQALLDLLEQDMVGHADACPVGSCAVCSGCH
ncbi:MAG: hypothetical protein IKG74_01375 [Firmicutes bacterium]|nr:hypothetical protein [Bacillota bacterium]